VAVGATTRRRGWRRVGSRGRFRYLDARGNPITDPIQLERIRSLAIPPSWSDVWISPDPGAKLQATGIDSAGRRQYRYNPDFRARQEQAKFDKLVRFGEKLPDLRAAMTEHMKQDTLAGQRVSAVALRVIDEGWFRVGSEKHLQRSGTYGVTTLLKSHVHVEGASVRFQFVGKRRICVRRALLDDELAHAIGDLKRVPGGPRLFRYLWDDDLHNLTSERLNRYIDMHMGMEFNAKDFRTWGGTLTAAVAFAERGPTTRKAEQKRVVAAVMRTVAERLGNTPSVARHSYVSPAVVEEYLEGRTIADFRPRHLRVLHARNATLDPEELELQILLRTRQERRAAAAA
jgi:DNA topoisomerase-1